VLRAFGSAACVSLENLQNRITSTHAIPVLYQCMIVAADGDKKEDHLYVVENVNPLLALRSLSTNIKHAVYIRIDVKKRLADACRSQPCSKNILVRR
jgi:hypothetical protein